MIAPSKTLNPRLLKYLMEDTRRGRMPIIETIMMAYPFRYTNYKVKTKVRAKVRKNMTGNTISRVSVKLASFVKNACKCF